jgi:hypothetical protein
MFLSITGVTPDNKLAKHQRFDIKADADNHAAKYNGFVVPDPGGNQEFWIVDPVLKTVTIDTAAEMEVTANRDWQAEIEATDAIMTNPADVARFMEEWYDANPDEFAKKPKEFRDNHTNRKEIRARRPSACK